MNHDPTAACAPEPRARASFLPQPVVYRGRLAAAHCPSGTYFGAHLQPRHFADPELVFVVQMASYARRVQAGELDGPYTDHGARRYARRQLIPDELLADPRLTDHWVATLAIVPVDEIVNARHERGLLP